MAADSVLADILSKMVGKECWGFIGGPGTGSMVNLAIGGKVPRKRPLKNPHLTEEQRHFEGETGLFIQFAAWRVDSEFNIECSSTSSNHKSGPMLQGLGRLVGRRLSTISMSQPGLDLTMEFEGKFFLRVFCNQTNLADEYDNYSVHDQDFIVSIGSASQLQISGRRHR